MRWLCRVFGHADRLIDGPADWDSRQCLRCGRRVWVTEIQLPPSSPDGSPEDWF